ncbi:MAG: rhodanese-like domain-containing protein [bacterium]
MIVRYRKEIVALGTVVTQSEIEQYRQEMSAEDFKKLLDASDLDDRVIVDMRNDYEYQLGHFKNAIPA